MSEKRTEIEEALDELFADPDSPDNGNDAGPPQTVANEPAGVRDERRHEIPYQR